MNKILYKDTSEQIIGAFYSVYNQLDSGFLESVYKKALIIEFAERKLSAETQKSLVVKYHNQLIGEFRADIVVENKIIVEVKAVSQVNRSHEAQLLNYLKATGLRVGFLVNFGKQLEFKRRVL
jgi:GxxExxY protein